MTSTPEISPDFPFESHYLEVEGAKLHYIDTGQGDPILFLHGNPKNMFVEQAIPGSIVRRLTEEEMNHYREPFTDPASRKPIWRWPNEIPIAGEPADVVEAVETYNQWLKTTELPKLLLYATPGAVIAELEVEWCKQNLKHLTTADIGQGIHYLQEDNPHGIGSALASWYRTL